MGASKKMEALGVGVSGMGVEAKVSGIGGKAFKVEEKAFGAK